MKNKYDSLTNEDIIIVVFSFLRTLCKRWDTYIHDTKQLTKIFAICTTLLTISMVLLYEAAIPVANAHGTYYYRIINTVISHAIVWGVLIWFQSPIRRSRYTLLHLFESDDDIRAAMCRLKSLTANDLVLYLYKNNDISEDEIQHMYLCLIRMNRFKMFRGTNIGECMAEMIEGLEIYITMAILGIDDI